MMRNLSRQVIKTLTYNSQAQDTIDVPAGRILNELDFVLDATLTTTAATLNPHPAGLANFIDRLEVYTANGKTIVDLSGQDLYDKFAKINGIFGDNVDLVGGVVANGTTARQTLRLPFFLEDGQRPDDGILQTINQDVKIRVSYKNPTAAGTLFGTVAGLSGVSVSLRVSMKEIRADQQARDAIMKNGVERSLRKFDYSITQTNDAFVLDKLPKNEVYRKLTLMARSTVNNMTVGTEAVIDHSKEMAVKSTADNNTYQRDVVRVFRGETLQKRQDASLTKGVIDVEFLQFGSIMEAIYSSNANELFVEVPAVATGANPFVRVIIDTTKNVLTA